MSQLTDRVHVGAYCSPEQARKFSAAARLRGHNLSMALRQAMDAYVAAVIASENDESRAHEPGSVKAGVGDRRRGQP